MLFKMNHISYLLFLLLLFTSLSATANKNKTLEVVIPQQKINLSYQVAPRLSQLLIDAKKNTDYSAYTLGSALIKKNSYENITIQNNKIELIESLETINHTSAFHLRTLIEGLNFFQQEKLSLDLEKVQLDSRINPIISGNYQLYLPKRPDFLILIDPNHSEKIIKLKLKPGYNLSKYLNEFYKNTDIVTDNIRIIQADKEVITPKIDYWSNSKYYLSPGAIIYIGLNEDIENAEITNQSFLKLLQHHVVY
ncbi:hypothetical protein OA92_12385 [Marinomonas sp. SBI22]|uniref:capsule biosynthesis GfcC D2 domain-containing protein n=1 Tax=unclassified Marinomonas TaxID=196814 RepID=UPI0007AFC2A7|nr:MULTISPECIES: capsule biosynthesis GfcC D2 domain-containing protein [unclassified Marinomonas]KZM42028.1 hypothetical protein OA92_12385 [Marinomonas sp. SBI22]KZM47129.1 hypothetical protein OA91_01020 [Marinomonas sp. SBI8L]